MKSKKRKHYAVVKWSPEDVQARKPDWSLKRCEDWIAKNERGIKEALTQAGNELLDDMNLERES